MAADDAAEVVATSERGAEASEPSWLASVEVELARICTAECVARRAIADIARELLPEPTPATGWLVRKEDDEIVLYAVVGRGLHVARGTCENLAFMTEENTEPQVTAAISYQRVPFRHDASFTSTISRKESRDGTDQPANRTTTQWSFNVPGIEKPIVLDVGTAEETSYGKPEPSREQAEHFATALTSAISADAAAREALLDMLGRPVESESEAERLERLALLEKAGIASTDSATVRTG